MNLNEVKAERGDVLAAAHKLVDASRASGKDMQGAALAQYNNHVAELKRIDAVIARHEELRASESRNGDRNPGSGFSGDLSNANNGKGTFRDIMARANGEQREQIQNLVGYLSGGKFSANADLTPGGNGAYLIPSFIVPTLERNYAAFAPVVSVARLWGTETGASVTFPVISDSESAVQLAPASTTGADATVSGDTPPTALTGPTLHAWKVSSKPVFVPRETFTDSPTNLIEEIIGSLLARIIRFENLKFTKGVGTTEAAGFITDSTAFTITHGSALDLDVALDLAYSVPPLYRSQGMYMMSDTTAKYLRKLKTGLSGDKRQLWADADATKGTPATLHGYPVIINNDMDDVAADGTFASLYPVAFGDFSKFVVRQAEMNQPFAYRYQVPAKDGAAVILFRRSDSKLLVPTAISKLAVAAS